MLARVRDKKTNIERTITYKSYSLIKHRYELLGYLNEDGTPSNGPAGAVQQNSVQNSVQKKRNVEPAVVERVKPTLTRADLDEMNRVAMEKALANLEAEKAKREIAEEKDRLDHTNQTGIFTATLNGQPIDVIAVTPDEKEPVQEIKRGRGRPKLIK
jgi:hypothetical protein